MNKNRVVITGVGVVSAYGLTTDDFWNGLISGKSAIRSFNEYDDIKMSKAALLPHFDTTKYFSKSDTQLLDRFSQLAILAARQAVADSGLNNKQIESAATILGSGAGGKYADEDGYHKLYKLNKSRVHPLMIPKGMHSAASSFVSGDIGSHGPTFSVSSACASGSHSLITGAGYIQLGVVDVAVVGATDAPFPYGLLKAWDSLKVVTNDDCRPFCKQRSGMILGEGAGVLIIESLEHAQSRNADIIAEVIGYGMTCDGGHATRPDINGVSSAMKKAISNSGHESCCVDYINAHGTGTIANDYTESQAIIDIYRESMDQIYVSSTKPLHGHALGASSAMEIISTALTIRDGLIPPLINYKEKDKDCDLRFVLNKPLNFPVNVAMTNSFAFGGLNASVLLKRF